MWFQTLKTRQSIKKIVSSNGNGQVAALEYFDKKVDVHMLKRESSPLSLEEGTLVAFLTLDDGSMYTVGVSLCGKGRAVLEFKVWDVMNALGFQSREIFVQDMERLNMNEGKFKSIVNISEPCNIPHHPLKIDSLMNYLIVAVGPGLVLMWRCNKVDNVVINLELVTIIRSTITIHDIILLYTENDAKAGLPSVVVGGSGGVQLFKASESTEKEDTSSFTPDEGKYISSFHCFPTGDHFVQEIQRSCFSTCILSDNSGSLWFFNSSKLSQIHLPSSVNGHGVFGLQMKCKSVPEGWMATVHMNHTINIYKLDDVLNMNNTGLIAFPWHVIFSTCQLNCAAFIDANTLVAGSPSNRSLSLWAGLNCLVK